VREALYPIAAQFEGLFASEAIVCVRLNGRAFELLCDKSHVSGQWLRVHALGPEESGLVWIQLPVETWNSGRRFQVAASSLVYPITTGGES
jgi:hypothetical protein